MADEKDKGITPSDASVAPAELVTATSVQPSLEERITALELAIVELTEKLYLATGHSGKPAV